MAATACLPAAASAATFVVTNTHDHGGDSLRQALSFANDLTGKDRIKVQTTGTVKLQTALPAIADDTVLIGPGASKFTVQRDSTAGFVRIFDIEAGVTVKISGLTARFGSLFEDDGAGVRNAGTLTLDHVVVTKNATSTASFGGVDGGGIYNSGTLHVISSTVARNSVVGLFGVGSGIATDGGTTTIERSTLSGNSGSGAVYNAASLTLANSTIAKNEAAGVISSSGATSIWDSTIAKNGTADEPANVYYVNSAVSFEDSIVAEPEAGATNCVNGGASAVSSLGFDLEDDATCPFGNATDFENTDPKLGKLKRNGGPTKTMAIPKSSKAADHGFFTGYSTDQRGKPRPHDFPGKPNATGGDGSDIGAFELQG
jgi:hypothetical protein